MRQHFGDFNPAAESNRAHQIHQFLRAKFPVLLGDSPSIKNQNSKINNRLGFDVAASGQGDLAAFYIATHAHTERRCTVGCAVLMEDGTIVSSDDPPKPKLSPEDLQRVHEIRMMNSNDPNIWQPLRF